MTRPFLFLLGLAVVLGVGLGGAFIGGVAFGKGQDDATANNQSAAAFGPGGPPAAGFAGGNQPGGFQQRPTGAGSSAQSDTETDSALSGQRGSPGVGDGAPARSGLMGTVATIEDNTFTVDTPQGPVQARLGEDTTITRVVEAAVDDLQVGAQVRVMGEEVAGEEGVTATSVLIIPEGTEGLLGRAPSGDRGFQPDRSGQ
jgi:hypothetical protein